MRHRRPRGTRRAPKVRRGRRAVVTLLVVFLVSVLVRTFLVTPFSIPSASMQETLDVGDRILVERVSSRFGSVDRGDVVVFDGADTFGAVDDGGPVWRDRVVGVLTLGLAGTSHTDYVKRVIGVGGDRVTCCDDKGRITVNGKPLDERRYLFPGDAPSQLRFDIRVPEGRLWVMGDHRSDSLDSRAHMGAPGGGTVPESDVIGRVLGVVWPLDRLGGLS